LRIRVSMSAMGSLMLINTLLKTVGVWPQGQTALD